MKFYIAHYHVSARIGYIFTARNEHAAFNKLNRLGLANTGYCQDCGDSFYYVESTAFDSVDTARAYCKQHGWDAKVYNRTSNKFE